MCGICGVLDLNGRRFPEQNLKAMTNVLRHRGPDDEGAACPVLVPHEDDFHSHGIHLD